MVQTLSDDRGTEIRPYCYRFPGARPPTGPETTMLGPGEATWFSGHAFADHAHDPPGRYRLRALFDDERGDTGDAPEGPIFRGPIASNVVEVVTTDWGGIP